MCSLVFAALKPSAVIVGRHGEVCNNKTIDRQSSESTRQIMCPRCTGGTNIDDASCSKTAVGHCTQ